ncbi:hypothetical protein [Rhizobium sp. BK376]|uniref:hypothetical protein n=1 Tax=Rhizobium sp. BK376 TaxID=2512149 RepID=UPI001051B916|nr:hypothetical protein [Rhizobium sp. BK376]TCR76812.1 hypothetical protein EV561_11972 [Rhizobium sp. BK376]
MDLLLAYTIFHVLVSLVEIVAGIAMVAAFINRRPADGWTKLFLATAAITLFGGFLFPFHGVTPAIVIGILNVVILLVTVFAWQRASTARLWNATFVIGALALLYFNCLVLIVQSFQKVPGLHDLAPVGNEPAVLVSQTVLFIAALVVGYLSFKGTRRIA